MKTFIGLLLSMMVVLPAYSQKMPPIPADQKVHKVEVVEVLQTSAYTYLKVKEDKEVNWLAIPKMEAKVGETYYTAGGMEMRDFASKELNRTFPLVYFMDYVSKTPEGALRKNATAAAPKETKSAGMPEHGTKSKLSRKDVKFKAVPGGISISELYKNAKKYEGKTVKVHGQVVKYTEKIMYKNWIHLQDGTIYNENYDLVITTTDSVNPGDYVTIKGKVSLNKDFGSGYSFSLMLEEAMIIKE